MKAYRVAVVVFSLVFVGIGIALLVVTAANGGGVVGFVLDAYAARSHGRAAATAATCGFDAKIEGVAGLLHDERPSRRLTIERRRRVER